MISVVAVDRMSRSVFAAMKPSIVVGEEGTNGGLWCSPVANTSRPTSSALSASGDHRLDPLVLGVGVAGGGVGGDVADGEDAELHAPHATGIGSCVVNYLRLDSARRSPARGGP